MSITDFSHAPLVNRVTPLAQLITRRDGEKVAFFTQGSLASLGKVPEDSEKWAAHILSMAHKEQVCAS